MKKHGNMKTEPANEGDPALHNLLRQWEPSGSLPPRLAERVWHWLARREAELPRSPWSLLMQRWATALARPSLAVSYLTILLLGGLVAGYWQARQHAAVRMTDALARTETERSQYAGAVFITRTPRGQARDP